MDFNLFNFPFCISMYLIISLLLNSKPTFATISIYTSCPNTTTFASKSDYDNNTNTVFNTLYSMSASKGFHNTHSGFGTKDTVYGFYLCRGDLDTSSCFDCVRSAISQLLMYCQYRKQGLVLYDECTLRYSYRSLSGRIFINQNPTIVMSNEGNVTGNYKIRVAEIVGEMMSNVSSEAAKGGSEIKYATGVRSVNASVSLYSMAQCTPDLSAGDCNECLWISVGRLEICDGSGAFQPNCNARYEIFQFFRKSSSRGTPMGVINNHRNPDFSSQRSLPPTPIPTAADSLISHATGATKKWKMVGIFVSMFVSICIAIWLIVRIRMHRHNMKANEIVNADIDEIRTMESLEFDLNTIKAATRNFSGDNKLGQGGFGEVFKGILEGGEEIAVKRLSKTSGQGVKEFKTEVLLVAKLQHNNLVKLLGFCLRSKEKILIYEYLQNSSLDKLLSDPIKRLSCDWKMRYKIIVGIARGLLYLHEDSRLKIIHRDLKPSNILLDDGMNPKISDFGLARLFGVDETQDVTKIIVGTYGYMAPEYATMGHYSVKSDIYSFGIIILEIVSGQKNRLFGRPKLEEALLHRAWRLWNERNALHLVDTSLDDSYPEEQVTKCIHIGLLCIQENAAERPRMTDVVAALSGQFISLPMPKAPKFFGDVGMNAHKQLASYNEQTRGDEIEYHNIAERSGIYSGTRNITDFYPR